MRVASRPLQLIVFSNLQLLDAEFTDSQIPGQVGLIPAFAPDVTATTRPDSDCCRLGLEGASHEHLVRRFLFYDC